MSAVVSRPGSSIIAGLLVAATEPSHGIRASDFTLDWTKGNYQSVILAASELVITAAAVGVGFFQLRCIQDAVGGRTVPDFLPAINWRGGFPALSTQPGASDILLFYCDGKNFWGTAITQASGANSMASFVLPLNDLGAGEVDLVPRYAGGSPTPTYSRATDASMVLSNGLVGYVAPGVPRSWYWPDTLAYGGYLAEGARTNLCLQSEDLATTWTNNASSESTNATTSPDGTATADKIVEDSASALHYVTQGGLSVTSGTTYTFSAFLKAGERTTAQLLFGSAGFAASASANFNLSAGTVTATGAGASASSITAFPDGWYRCTVTAVSDANSAAQDIFIVLQTASYQGDGTSGLFAWGAQLEAASFASSYIPTTTASVTRNADVLTYPFAGNADATQGTAYAELGTEWTSPPANSMAIAFTTFPQLGNNTGEASTAIRMSDGTTGLAKVALSNMASASRKRASSWGAGGQNITGDGIAVSNAAFDGATGSTSIAVGCNTSGGTNWFGPIKNVAIFPAQFTNLQLQGVTAS